MRPRQVIVTPTKNAIWRWPTVRPRIGGVSRTTVWRWERDGLFPRRVKLSAGVIGWRAEEVIAWIESRDRMDIDIPDDAPEA